MGALVPCESVEEGRLEGLLLPVIVRPNAPMSDDDLLLFSSRNEPYRIELNAQGELEIMSPTGGDGGECEAFVIRHLGHWTERNGGRYFSSSAGFRLPDGSVLSPDASWVSEERWAALSREQRRKFPPLCPEFVIEVRSESDSRRVLEKKMELWIANGAQLAWLIDPLSASFSLFRPEHAVESFDRPGWVEAGEPVPGFRLETSRLWEM